MKRALAIIMLSCIIASICLISNVHATDAIGRITSDTTWTKSQSPITLTGPVNVNTEVTLTIEPGVTVKLNNYYIQVEGTLQIKGTSSDLIQLKGGDIRFIENSI